MSGVAVDSEIYRLTAEQYHLLIESGAFDEKSRVELIDAHARPSVLTIPQPRSSSSR